MKEPLGREEIVRGEAPRPRDLTFELPLLAVAFAGVIFFAGVHRSFIAAHFLATLALAFFAFGRAALTGKLRLAFPIFGAVPIAVVAWAHLQSALGISVAPDESKETLLRYGAPSIVFFLSSFAARDGAAVRRLGLGVALLAAFEVLYGIAEHFGGREYVLFWPKRFPGALSGTYENRDHFAGMLVLAGPLLLGLAQTEPWRWPSAPALSTRLSLALDQPGFWRAGAFFAAAGLAGLGIVLSFSRGGVLAFLFALLVYAALASRGRVSTAKTRLLAVLGLVTLVGLGAALYGSTDPLLQRFSSLSTETKGQRSRLAFVKGTLELIAERPLAGSGIGTFERNFTHVEKAWFQRQYLEHAHCDVLELPSEIGIPLAAASGAALLACIVSALRKTTERTVSCGLAAAFAGAAAHACVDFALQREGNLVFAAFLLGLLLGPRAPRAVLLGRSARIAGPLLALALLPLIPYPLRVLRAELLVLPTVRAEDDARTPEARLADAEKAIELRPEHSLYRRLAIEARLDGFIRSIGDAARESAKNLAGDPPPEDLVASLRARIAASRQSEAATLQSRSLADVRAAAASDPANARMLSLLALVTLDADEAKRAGERAVREFPFGADVLIEAGIGRLKCVPDDPDAEKLLAGGLALDPELLGYAGFHASAFGLERQLSAALPDAAAHHEWAKTLLDEKRGDLLGEELDAIAQAEERRPVPAPPGPGNGRTILIVKPEEWLDKPGGFAHERLAASVLRLTRRRAGTRLPGAGTLLVETSLVPGHAPVYVCVVHEGKHLGHLLVAGDWATSRFSVPGEGWLELQTSLERHGLVPAEPDAGVLVRDVALVTRE